MSSYLLRMEILGELTELFPNAKISVLDRDYNVVSRGSMEKFGRELVRELARYGISQWHPEFDCEDWCQFGQSLAKVKHVANKLQGKRMDLAEGVAVGWLCYLIAGNRERGHAVMLFRTPDGWEAYEPQKQAFFELTERERLSCWSVQV